jgi:hypothetical protein
VPACPAFAGASTLDYILARKPADTAGDTRWGLGVGIMRARRYVCLDPDGMADSAWLFVVVSEKTGVVYQQQYGGTACRQGQMEGFLVPVAASAVLPGLRDLFERHFRGAGTWNHTWPQAEREVLRRLVGEIVYWASDGVAEEPSCLRLDEGRIRQADEAWVPVVTQDGVGVLVWANSD